MRNSIMTNRVQITNTPIFDRLAREMGYRHLIAPKPLEPVEVYQKRPNTMRGMRPAGYIVDEYGTEAIVKVDGAQTDEAVDAALIKSPDLWKITEEE
jgi:hypothetical protein